MPSSKRLCTFALGNLGSKEEIMKHLKIIENGE